MNSLTFLKYKLLHYSNSLTFLKYKLLHCSNECGYCNNLECEKMKKCQECGERKVCKMCYYQGQILCKECDDFIKSKVHDDKKYIFQNFKIKEGSIW